MITERSIKLRSSVMLISANWIKVLRKIAVFDNELLTCYQLNPVSSNIIWDNFLILIGFTVSDFGELEVPLTDTENHNYITSGTTVKNSLECGTDMFAFR